MSNDKPHVFDLKNPASAAALRASMGRALKPRPKAGEVLGPDGKPVAPVEMKELKPYELEPGDEAAGDFWQIIRRSAGGEGLEFRDSWGATANATPDGKVHLQLQFSPGHGDPGMDCGHMHWKQWAGKLAEILKTARANYGEDWGK